MSDMTFKLRRKNLQWHICGVADWQASSKYHDDGSHFTWRISVSDNGKFSLQDSTPELLTGLDNLEFSTFDEAVAFCEAEEAIPARPARSRWMEESEITSHLIRAIMRPHSRVIDGKRLFPPFRMDNVTGFTIHPKEDEIELDIDAVLKTAAIAIRLKTDGGKDG